MFQRPESLRIESDLSPKAFRQRLDALVAAANRSVAARTRNLIEWRLVELWDGIELRWVVHGSRGGSTTVFVGTVTPIEGGSLLSGVFQESLGWRLLWLVPSIYTGGVLWFAVTKLWGRFSPSDWPVAALLVTPFVISVGFLQLSRTGRRSLERRARDLLLGAGKPSDFEVPGLAAPHSF
jgi:hypothetical protein